MIQVKVKNNKGFPWYIKDNIYAKGFLYAVDNRLYEKENLFKYFKNVNNIQELINKVTEANGLFSVIIKLDDRILSAVDRLRTFPLFYNEKSENQIITDNPEILISNGYTKINSLYEREFLSAGIVTGNKTLISGIYQLQTGACIELYNQSAEQFFYHSYVTDKVLTQSYNELTFKFRDILNSSFNRFVQSLNGRTVLLSLSGGYDSRLIAVMLKKMKYDNVICYSYGNPENKEAKISQRVAQRLGYDWRFIDYKRVVHENYIDDPVFREYYPYAATYTSMFFLEQYFAVKFFKDSKSIPDDAIFCAGHSGDFLAGSQLTKNGNIREQATIDKIAKSILKNKYSLHKIDREDRPIFLQHIHEYLQNSLLNSNTLAYSIFENWDLKEKLAKFIFNSAVVYNYFDFEHRLPLMDIELFDFFKLVPYQYKLHKRLYDDVLKNHFFEKYNLNFESELQPNKYQIYLQNTKNKIRPYLPDKWQARNRMKNDLIYHSEITEVLVKDAVKDEYQIQLFGKNFNPVIIQWYLQQVRKRFL